MLFSQPVERFCDSELWKGKTYSKERLEMTSFCLSNKCFNLLVKQVVWKYLQHFILSTKMPLINMVQLSAYTHTHTQNSIPLSLGTVER